MGRPKTGGPDFRVGLNPYGTTYHLGLQGQGTPRQNAKGRGLDAFLELVDGMGARSVEIADGWISGRSEDELRALRDRLAESDIEPVISGSLITESTESMFRSARLLGAKKIRFVLTRILCGDRAEREDWDDLKRAVEGAVKKTGARAAEDGIRIGIENHQDFTSAELVELCQMGGPGVAITYDTGNSFPVGEAPMDFTRRVAPHVCHVHLKDYHVQFTPEGFRLIRCVIGDGAVPFAGIFAVLGEHHDTMTASLELAALEARHVRLFRPDWWTGYPERTATSLAACLWATQGKVVDPSGDYRTPWERGADDELEAYELDQFRQSVDNMRSMGIL